ncbi:hypothetical protein V1282_004348 [Nitrobacteraceae bacterium AZCC 2146]
MAISALAKSCPTWAEFRPIHAFEAQVDVVATRRSGVLTSVFELRVVQISGEIWVFERPVGNRLPACCPERHINPGGSFCIGLNAGKGITHETAPAWWVKLHAFVLLQETAAETGLWPSQAQLSHGEAGEIELKAERAAEQIGLLSAYRDAVVFDTGPIASALAKIDPKTGLLRNGRSACICGRLDRHRSVLRRDCHRSGLGCPIVLEHSRRIKLAEYWHGLRGQPCCGTMRECPLKVSGEGG